MSGNSRSPMVLVAGIFLAPHMLACVFQTENEDSDSAEYEARLANIASISEALEHAGIPSEIDTESRSCDCSGTSLLVGCDYIIYPAFGYCWPQGTLEAVDDDLQVVETQVRNVNADDNLFVQCSFPEIYRHSEGFGLQELDQVVAFGVNNDTLEDLTFDLFTTTFSASSWTRQGECDLASSSSSMVRACTTMDDMSIPSTHRFLVMNVGIPDQDGIPYPGVNGFLFCYDPD